MSKAQFVQEIQAVAGQLSPEAREYFNKYVAAKRVDKKAQDKAAAVKAAIVEVLRARAGEFLTRTELADAVHNSGDLVEAYTTNDKGEVAYSSFSAYANQLTTEGALVKEKRITGQGKGRTEVVVYGLKA